MRIFLSPIVVLLTGLSASAQQKESLDTVLQGWEKAMTDVRSFAAVAERETIDKAVRSEELWHGLVMFNKSTRKGEGNQARLELYKMAKPENRKDQPRPMVPAVLEKYLCDGKDLFEYAPVNKVVRVRQMPQNGPDQSFLSFLFGMSAADAKTRYNMTLVYPTGQPDPHYHYVRIKPRTDKDKNEFAEAELVLYRANNLPARIWYWQRTGTEIKWEFKKLQVDVQIPAAELQFELPKGWTLQRLAPK